jgi:peptidyl-prolyl cis-trans isomerase SurA
MRRFKIQIVAFIAFVASGSLFSQGGESSNDWVFKAGNQKVYTDEFERQFLKNLNIKEKPVTSADIDEYLRLYTRFKLKIQDAVDAGKDSLPAYRQELAMYREQLARNYLYDRNVTQKLIEEAYERMSKEVRVSHILIKCDRNASDETVSKAEKRMKEIHAALLRNPSKENFSSFALSDSEDPGTKSSGGDLGYMTALQVVYEFENAAYSTPKDGISDIFRTDFGFHILRVEDIRPNLGEIKVRHILIRSGANANVTVEEGERKINEIREKISSGAETFESMARIHSEDFSSKYNGGLIDWLTVNQFVGDIERQEWLSRAFALEKNGDITAAFKTNYGWHLLQKVEVRPLSSFEIIKNQLKTKVQQNQRSQISIDSLVSKIQRAEGYQLNQAIYDFLMTAMSLDSSVSKGTFKSSNLPETITINDKLVKKNYKFHDAELYRFAGESYTVGDFAERIEAAKKVLGVPAKDYLKGEFESWVKNVCVSYQNEHLEEKSPEFRFIYQEYREGILMFNRMQEVVWDRANTDSVGLAEYFNQNIKDYQWDDRFHVEFYFCSSKDMMNTVAKQVKKGIAVDSIRKQHTKKSQLDFSYKAGKYQLKDTFLFPSPKALKGIFADAKYKKKANQIYKLGQLDEDFVVVKVVGFLPAGPKSLEETRGPVASKYQEVLEKKWMQDLESKYSVEVNQAAVQQIKNKLNAK